jgi:hypothetical protein
MITGAQIRNAGLLLVVALIGARVVPVSAKPAPRPSEQIELYDTLNDLCRGVGSPQAALAGCNEMERLYPRIKAPGWCKGRARQAAENAQWHVCGRGSL